MIEDLVEEAGAAEDVRSLPSSDVLITINVRAWKLFCTSLMNSSGTICPGCSLASGVARRHASCSAIKSCPMHDTSN